MIVINSMVGQKGVVMKMKLLYTMNHQNLTF